MTGGQGSFTDVFGAYYRIDGYHYSDILTPSARASSIALFL
jgi:hypothetical protein